MWLLQRRCCGFCRELQGMRASLMGLDKIYHHHGIMPGAVRSSPVFDNASRALQRLTLDNEAAAAVATADWQAMEQVLEVAKKQNNQVVAHRMEVSFVSCRALLDMYCMHFSLDLHANKHIQQLGCQDYQRQLRLCRHPDFLNHIL